MFKFLKQLFGGDCEASDYSGTTSCSCGKAPEKVISVSDLQDFVAYVAKALVDDPDSITVSAENGENGVKILRISCRKEDTGKIIGKKGKTISAVRALVSGAAGRLQERVSVEVAD